MFGTSKYIRTKENNIIVFSPLMQHKEFRSYNPISAGFISFGVNNDGNPSCTCYGKSDSLGIESIEGDSKLAERQILNNPLI